MSNALKKITTRAKQIRRSHPGIAWKTAIKRAGAEYRGGKKTVSRSAPKKSKKRSVQKRKTRAVAVTAVHGNGESPITMIKSMLKTRLGKALLRKELAKGKRDKRREQKTINSIRQQLRTASKL
ncbi:MAG: hypothetical protein V4721_12445 [Bacteroidota bacterium]